LGCQEEETVDGNSIKRILFFCFDCAHVSYDTGDVRNDSGYDCAGDDYSPDFVCHMDYVWRFDYVWSFLIMIDVYFNDEKCGLDRFIFPGGEAHFKSAAILAYSGTTRIETDFQNHQDLMTVMLLADHIDRVNLYSHEYRKSLVMKYTPYARQDRVTSKAEPFSFKTFARLINSCSFDCVSVTDPHSDVTTALLNNVSSMPRHILINEDLGFKFDVLVSPDSGAMKANHEVCKRFKLEHVVATKHRDTSTGKITETKIHTDINMKGKKILVADDLCDGGRTFIELAKVIRKYEPSALELYVTHGLFSNGMKELYEHYDKVHCHYNCKTGQSL
jgi:ribose-phosphate pyrophosphokinase